jgi:hypothetical protein
MYRLRQCREGPADVRRHGYIAETGVEQFVRDARIAMIYEGANGVQAMDLVGRKLGRDGGRAIMAFFDEKLKPFIEALAGVKAHDCRTAPCG